MTDLIDSKAADAVTHLSEQTAGGELVVRLLRSLGVRHMFGVPGGQTLAITDAVLGVDGIDFVTARHEGGASVMADAYGRLTKTPGVCLATTGPGATNLLTGVGGALRDSSPALVITCNNHGENIHKDDAQNADHIDIFRQFTKWSRLVAHATSIGQAIEEAFVQAMTGNPGPVHLDFARDTIEAPIGFTAEVPDVHPLLAWIGQRPRPDEDALSEVVARIAAAERPVLWVGGGVIRSGATEAVLALATAMDIPVITTFNGIGAVPTSHPLVFGALSRMGTSLTSRVVAESDLVLAVGNSLNAVSTRRWSLELPEVVQIDVEPETIGRYYGAQTTGLIGDARATLEAITERLAEAGAEPGDQRRAWVAELREARSDWWAPTLDPPSPLSDAISPADVVMHLRKVVPDETLLIPDAGNPGVWSYLWHVHQADTYIKPVGFGNMGFAVPAAVAAAVIDPDRPVVVLVGDGSLGMSLGELETLGRVGGRVCVVVLNDAGYGNIRQEQIVHFDGRTIGVDFSMSDFGQVARGLGIEGHRIQSIDELCERVQTALTSSKPVLLDVPIDPAVNAWTYPAFQRYEPTDE